MEIKKIAGLCFKGGMRDNFFFCLLEDFQDTNRLFLKSLLRVKEDEEVKSGDDAIRKWINKFEIKNMVIDFPLTPPPCQTCNNECLGRTQCFSKDASYVNQEINKLLDEDTRLQQIDPKKYERDRNLDDEVDYSRDVVSEETDSHILSRSFKRRLKRGFLPYWNRAIDFYIWKKYYDQMLKLFNISYDSFGNSSLKLYFRLNYLKRHFPNDFVLYESNVYIFLIELLRKKYLLKRDLQDFLDVENGAGSRLRIIESIEKTFSVFIYEADKDTLIKYPHAFQSFLLALIGWFDQHYSSVKMPEWTNPSETNFLIPLL